MKASLSRINSNPANPLHGGGSPSPAGGGYYRKINLLLAIAFAFLMSVNSAYAQAEEILLKFIVNAYIKDKQAKEKLAEIQPTYNAWLNSLNDYVKKTGAVGDCKTIGFKQLANNRDQTKSFYFECGVEDGNIAFLIAKSKSKVGACPEQYTFRAEFDRRKGHLETYALPVNDACLFFKVPPIQEQKGMWGGSAGGIGTSAKSTLKAPSQQDVEISDPSPRSKADIMAVVSQRMPGLRRIYNQHLKTNPNLNGKIKLNFNITPSGDIIVSGNNARTPASPNATPEKNRAEAIERVLRSMPISIMSSTTNDSRFDQAIINAVATWKWKSIGGDGNTGVTITFTFEE